MNKKAFLLAEETVKVILAVIVLVVLVYFLTSVYFSKTNSKDLDLAKSSLEHLIEEINAEVPVVEIYNPASSLIVDWRVVSFSNSGDIPLSCSNLGWSNCICICELDFLDFDSDAEDCDEEGICLEKDFKVLGPIKIKNPPIKLKIDYAKKEITEK